MTVRELSNYSEKYPDYPIEITVFNPSTLKHDMVKFHEIIVTPEKTICFVCDPPQNEG